MAVQGALGAGSLGQSDEVVGGGVRAGSEHGTAPSPRSDGDRVPRGRERTGEAERGEFLAEGGPGRRLAVDEQGEAGSQPLGEGGEFVAVGVGGEVVALDGTADRDLRAVQEEAAFLGGGLGDV